MPQKNYKPNPYEPRDPKEKGKVTQTDKRDKREQATEQNRKNDRDLLRSTLIGKHGQFVFGQQPGQPGQQPGQFVFGQPGQFEQLVKQSPYKEPHQTNLNPFQYYRDPLKEQ